MIFIYEFCGKPASGKTFICRKVFRAVADKFPSKKVRLIQSSDSNCIFRAVKKIVFLAYRSVFHFNRTWVVITQTALCFSSLSLGRCIMLLLNFVYLDFRISTVRDRDEVVILDQGFLQLCWANLNADNSEKVKSLLLSLYQPYLGARIHLVHVDAQGEVLDRRVNSRDDLNYNNGYRPKNFDNANLHNLRQFLTTSLYFELIDIDNNVDSALDIDVLIKSLMIKKQARGNSHEE